MTADAWAGLPVIDDSVDVVLSVFSPRNADEFARVLRSDGCVISVTPDSDHLSELRSTFGLLGVEDGKERRLADAFGRSGLITAEQQTIRRRDPWTADDAVRSIMMGPNAFHSRAEAVRAEAASMDLAPAGDHLLRDHPLDALSLRSNGSWAFRSASSCSIGVDDSALTIKALMDRTT